MLSRILKSQVNFSRNYNDIAYLTTGRSKLQKKKVSKIKNNFQYRNEFNEFRKTTDIKDEVTSSDLIRIENESIKPKITKKKLLSPLQYKGEILFGIHPVYLALLQMKRNIYQLFLKTNKEKDMNKCNSLRKKEMETIAKTNGIPIRYIDTRGMKYLALDVVHQGVCVDASPLPLQEWQETESSFLDFNSSSLWLVLDEISDPMNVGAIIRSAYYFGVHKLFVVKGKSCRLSPTVSKASSGALEVMDIHQIEKLEDFIQARKNIGWNIISTLAYCEDHKDTFKPVLDISDVKAVKPTILILGNEGRGISSDIQKLCDSFISINPYQQLCPGIDSLNVSVAAGVILHAISSQQQRKIVNV